MLQCSGLFRETGLFFFFQKRLFVSFGSDMFAQADVCGKLGFNKS